MARLKAGKVQTHGVCVLVSQRDTLDIGVGAWTANLSGDPVYLSD